MQQDDKKSSSKFDKEHNQIMLQEGWLTRLLARHAAQKAAKGYKGEPGEPSYASIKVKSLSDSILAKFKKTAFRLNEKLKRRIEGDIKDLSKEVGTLINKSSRDMNILLKKYVKDIGTAEVANIEQEFKKGLADQYIKFNRQILAALNGLIGGVSDFKISAVPGEVTKSTLPPNFISQAEFDQLDADNEVDDGLGPPDIPPPEESPPKT